jgi:hypothetical protein
MPPHDHDHEPTDAGHAGDAVPGYYEIMETSIRELLVEKHLIGPGEIRRQIDVLDSRTPALGARVVARAWVRLPVEPSRLSLRGRLHLTSQGERPRRARARGDEV